MAAVPAELGRPEEAERGPKRPRREERRPQEERRPRDEPPAEPGYLALARRLLAGGSPALRGPAPARPAGQPAGDGAGDGDDLLGQLIRDLNEINEVPFFDVQLPYELALKIFQYLGKAELGRCAQVSRTWKVLAEDQVLWYRLCQEEGFLLDRSISDQSCWKLALKTCRAREHTLKYNWKNRIGAVSQLRYEPGKILCDVHSCEGVVIAGYTSGEVRLWDTRTWDYTAPALEGVPEPGPRPHVSFVRINSSLAVAAHEDGTITVWNALLGQEPIHHYQHNQRLQALALGPEGAAVATASGFEVRLETPRDTGFWQTTATFEIQKLVNFLNLVPDVSGGAVAVAAAEDIVYLLKAEDPGKVLHSVYGQPVTCLDVSAHEAAFGIKTFGWLLNEPNQILLYNLETNQCLTKVGNSIGDFTCVNLHASPPHMLVAGNKDRRWTTGRWSVEEKRAWCACGTSAWAPNCGRCTPDIPCATCGSTLTASSPPTSPRRGALGAAAPTTTSPCTASTEASFTPTSSGWSSCQGRVSCPSAARPTPSPPATTTTSASPCPTTASRAAGPALGAGRGTSTRDKHLRPAGGCRICQKLGYEPKQRVGALEHLAEMWGCAGVQRSTAVQGRGKGNVTLQGEQKCSCCLWERCCWSHLGRAHGQEAVMAQGGGLGAHPGALGCPERGKNPPGIWENMLLSHIFIFHVFISFLVMSCSFLFSLECTGMYQGAGPCTTGYSGWERGG
ncbi:F-box/WD repeat-containing protein 8 isoform X1 [Pithys albifrons albifrons]|uniref:F-box/WD repeat-containing protein 8 isoform X1 n=1 Tax=Pithys albifrons albifrons TaxID=3385563 RepID=UPI003A5CD6B8